MEGKEDAFSYSYSAKQQEEVNAIRLKYAPAEESKMDRLRKLDQSATRNATAASIALGVVSSLVLGVGMCCVTVWTDLFALGIVVGVIGLAGVAVTYPFYRIFVKREREKLAPQILRLTDELMKH